MPIEESNQANGDFVSLDEISRIVAEKSLQTDDWSGLPIPVPGLKLVLEPRYKRKSMASFKWKECITEDGTPYTFPEEQAGEPSEWRCVNSWWNARLQATISVYQNESGESRFGAEFQQRLAFLMRTLDAAAVWPIEAEQKALAKLQGLVPKHVFEMYQLTGHFLETSRRSKLTYMFRRSRPTLVLRELEDGILPLCALCLHPIGYYSQSWAGVMCPTDEVLAHLLFMRGSEEKYWANANQHPLDHPAAGI